MGHVALLGDSILDNRAYTGGEPDVVSHLRAMLPDGWEATLLAVDGSTMSSIASQLRRLPRGATHVVLAVGGNDALMQQDLLSTPVRSTADALGLFASRVAQFERDYRAVVDSVVATHLPATVCTIYNGNLEEPRATLARVGLTLFDDAILRAGFERHLTVIDLRLVCSEPQDYANPIEPSGRGGKKIADAIARAVGVRPGPATRVLV